MVLSKSQQRFVRGSFGLSERELEVLILLCNGVESSKKLGEILRVSPSTIKVYLQRIYRKFGERSKLKVVLKVIDILNLH